ncbi:MAG: serine/threonine-protein phosphatase [Desulfobacterales bacterium]|nr:serine/threonine-protein phosphatase [Desulfobacterales bacterium]
MRNNTLPPIQPNNSNQLILFRELLEYWATIQDQDADYQLLRELVLKYAHAEKKLSTLNRELLEKQERLDEDLKAASEIQQSLLPKRLPQIHSMEFAWKFIPSEIIGGDIFNVFYIDDEHIGLYMLDVSGHGVPAAMITVSVSQMLQTQQDFLIRAGNKDKKKLSPQHILNTLDHEYPIERFDKFFTIIYLIININSGRLMYSNAGHPPPILLHSDGNYELLNKGGTIIGMGGLIPFEEETKQLQKGDKLILYTDGMTEYLSKNKEYYGIERVLKTVCQRKDDSIQIILNEMLASMMYFGDHVSVQDDISILGIHFNGNIK